MLDRDAIVICDGGDFASYAGRAIESYEPGCWLDPGPFGCLGCGPGYALAAKLARPDRQVVLLLGDGAFGFSGMEWDTLARHGVGVVGVVGNNGIWGLEKHPMEFLYGYSVVADLRPETRYDAVVEALGGHGALVREPAELRPALERALAAERAGARERAHGPRGRLPEVSEPGLRREAASRRGEAASSWPRQDGQGYVPWGPLRRPRRREAPIDAAIARVYASGDGGGRHVRPYRRIEYLSDVNPPPSYERPGCRYFCRLNVRFRSPLPRGCRDPTPRLVRPESVQDAAQDDHRRRRSSAPGRGRSPRTSRRSASGSAASRSSRASSLARERTWPSTFVVS